MDRRHFLRRTLATALLPGATLFFTRKSLGNALSVLLDQTDEEICLEKFALVRDQHLEDKPIAELIVAIGNSFIGTEYGEHLLEEEGPEHLVVNLRRLDCVTFYESSLAIARCVKLKKATFDEFKAQLQLIRYRGGVIDGYSSRLHYTSDAWADDEKRGILRVVTKDLFGVKQLRRIPSPVNFMSTHRSAYRQLADGKFFDAMKRKEEEISKREVYFLPKGHLPGLSYRITPGSLIGITTSVPGLDISHTGIAVRAEDGSLHLLHAPDVGDKVQVSQLSLEEYLSRNRKQTGIVIAEALEPHS